MNQKLIHDVMPGEAYLGISEDGERMYKTIYYIQARTEYGHAWVYRQKYFDTELEALDLASDFNRLDLDELSLDSDWRTVDPIYGSQAYQDEGCEELNRQREIEDDYTYYY